MYEVIISCVHVVIIYIVLHLTGPNHWHCMSFLTPKKLSGVLLRRHQVVGWYLMTSYFMLDVILYFL